MSAIPRSSRSFWLLLIAHASVLILVQLLSGTVSAADDKRVALVIGNNKYPSAALKNPVNDATAMAKTLQEMGFEVILRTDVNQRQLNRAITEFGEKLTRGSVGLFYYAGHGLQARGRNFLVPVDAEITSENAVSTEAVDVERVLDQLGSARLSMVILDACRNNPFERRFRSGSGSGLAQIDAPAGTVIAYATSPGKVALDGEGTHGTYTDALLKAIQVPGQRIEDVFKQVRINVMRATGNQQVPWESSSLTGDFTFRARQAVAQQPASNPQQDAAAAALREQMAALQAEIVKMREQRPAAAAPAVDDAEFKRAQKEAAALREQLAAINADIAKLREARPAPQANAAPKPAAADAEAGRQAAALREQMAHLNAELARMRTMAPSAVREPTAEETALWKAQMAKVEALRGKLTLSSALSTLLDMSDADASVVRQFEAYLSGRAHTSAFAMGVDANGMFVAGGSFGYMYRDARPNALGACDSTDVSQCKVVFLNGKFSDDDWLQVAKRLGRQPVNVVRAALVRNLSQPIVARPDPSGHMAGVGRLAHTYSVANAQ